MFSNLINTISTEETVLDDVQKLDSTTTEEDFSLIINRMLTPNGTSDQNNKEESVDIDTESNSKQEEESLPENQTSKCPSIQTSENTEVSPFEKAQPIQDSELTDANPEDLNTRSETPVHIEIETFDNIEETEITETIIIDTISTSNGTEETQPNDFVAENKTQSDESQPKITASPNNVPSQLITPTEDNASNKTEPASSHTVTDQSITPPTDNTNSNPDATDISTNIQSANTNITPSSVSTENINTDLAENSRTEEPTQITNASTSINGNELKEPIHSQESTLSQSTHHESGNIKPENNQVSLTTKSESDVTSKQDETNTPPVKQQDIEQSKASSPQTKSPIVDNPVDKAPAKESLINIEGSQDSARTALSTNNDNIDTAIQNEAIPHSPKPDNITDVTSVEPSESSTSDTTLRAEMPNADINDNNQSASQDSSNHQNSKNEFKTVTKIQDKIIRPLVDKDINAETAEHTQKATKTVANTFETVLTKTERFQDVIDRFDEHVLTTLNTNNKQMNIHLMPQNLGKLSIHCREINGELILEITSENKVVRDLLSLQEDAIKTVVENTGLKVTQFDVRAQADNQQSKQFDTEWAEDSRRQNSPKNQQSDSTKPDTDENLVTTDNTIILNNNPRSGVWIA